MVTYTYKIGSEIWGPFHPQKWRAKTKKQNKQIWCDFRQLRDVIVSISRTQQDIVHRKTTLQTPACTYFFGEPRWTNGENSDWKIDAKSTFWISHISGDLQVYSH